MMVAVPVQHSVAADEKTRLCVTLWIEFNHVEPVAGDTGDKGNVVAFRHWVVNSDIMLVFYHLTLHSVHVIRFLGLHWGEYDTAAGNHSRTGTVQHVAADGADIKL